jgi:hypothetical protein
MPFQRSCLSLAIALATAVCLPAADELRTTATLPHTQDAARTKFAQLGAFTLLPVREGEPLRMTGLAASVPESLGIKTTVRIGSRELPVPMARRSVMTLGLTMTAAEQATLPLLSASTIQSRIDRQFVTVQALVRRDLDTGRLCLHDRAAAAQLQFATPRISVNFEDLVKISLADTRSLGLFSVEDRRTATEPPRTLVLLTRNGTKLLEYCFLHARPAKTATEEDDLEIHAFSTTKDMTVVKYLRPFAIPQSTADCDIVGSIALTRYAADGLTPTAAEVRSLDIHSQAEFTVERLNAYAREQKLGEHYLDRLSDVLDAIVAGKLKP